MLLLAQMEAGVQHSDKYHVLESVHGSMRWHHRILLRCLQRFAHEGYESPPHNQASQKYDGTNITRPVTLSPPPPFMIQIQIRVVYTHIYMITSLCTL